MERKDIEKKAVDYLARRDHGVEELKAKLSRLTDNNEIIEQIIAKMKDLNYLSDERFVEAFVRYQKRKQQGPLKIKSLLTQKNIDESLISQFLDYDDEQFYDECHKLLLKKTNGSSIKDIKEKQKIIRFLSSRGFIYSHINFALENT